MPSKHSRDNALGEDATCLAAELETLKVELAPKPDVKQTILLESAFCQLVRLHIVITPVRAITACFHFPEGYPATASLSCALSSNTLGSDVLSKLEAGADKEAQSRLGSYQILPVVRWLERFLAGNRLQLIAPAARSQIITKCACEHDFGHALEAGVPEADPIAD